MVWSWTTMKVTIKSPLRVQEVDGWAFPSLVRRLKQRVPMVKASVWETVRRERRIVGRDLESFSSPPRTPFPLETVRYSRNRQTHESDTVLLRSTNGKVVASLARGPNDCRHTRDEISRRRGFQSTRETAGWRVKTCCTRPHTNSSCLVGFDQMSLNDIFLRKIRI